MPDNNTDSQKTYSTGELAQACALVVREYRKRTAYLCPHCRRTFVPKVVGWFFATHTPTTRKVTCTHCGTTDWCAEVSRDRLKVQDAV